MASQFAIGNHAVKGRCGHFVEVIKECEYIDRVRCNACNRTEALWRDGERVQDQAKQATA